MILCIKILVFYIILYDMTTLYIMTRYNRPGIAKAIIFIYEETRTIF
jgi:hypothetical protein